MPDTELSARAGRVRTRRSRARILRLLETTQINVEYMYAFLGGQKDSAYMIFKVERHHQAAAALTAKGIRLVDQEELSEL